MIYHSHYPLLELNAFKTKAFAKLFCEPSTVSELRQVIYDYPIEKKLVIGSGCNLFFTQDYDGVVIHPQIKGYREVEIRENGEIIIEAMASEDWDSFVAYCVANGYAGLENLSYIPGTVGAAPVQNIGAYGVEVGEYIQEVVALDLHSGEAVSFSNEECRFGYRNSVFKQTKQYVIVSVLFKLSRHFCYREKYQDLNKELSAESNPTLLQVRDAVIRVRKRKLPSHTELSNCGSFFKNPYVSPQKALQLQAKYPDIPLYYVDEHNRKTSAAYLIDKAGMKGVRRGMVGTYPLQPLIVVNYGTSKGADIVRFMHEIQQAVWTHFGIELEPEVRIF